MTAILFLFVGSLLGIILFFYPVVATWVMLLMSMVVAGTVTYFFPEFKLIRWAIVPISLALIFRAVLCFMTYTPKVRREKKPPFVVWLLLLVVVVGLTTAVNHQLKETLIAAKNFFQFWSIPLAFIFLIKEELVIAKFMKALLIIASIQPLLAIIQYLFFTGHFPGDSVTGTFGGKIAGGGPNAALSIFMAVEIAVVLAFAQKHVIRQKTAVLLTFWFLVPILLCHSKMTVFYFPIIFAVLYGREFLKNILPGTAALLMLTMICTGVFYFHYSQSGHYSASGSKASTLSEYIDQISHYNIADRHREKKLSRVASVTFWLHEHSFTKNPVQTLIGHGLGAARQSGLVDGHIGANPRYSEYEIGRFALPRLLWDLGIIGTMFFIMVYISSFFVAGRLKTNARIPKVHQAYLAAAQLACLLFVLSLPYKLSIINVQAFNAFSMFILGYIGFWFVELQRCEQRDND